MLANQGKDESTIFLVDDDPAIRRSLPRALRTRGFQVEVFESAAAFLEVIDPTKPGCLILDQGMPNMTGLELQLELAERSVDIPIIFISGHAGVQNCAQAMRAGAIDFLEKPFRQDDLLQRVDEAMSLDAKNRREALP